MENMEKMEKMEKMEFVFQMKFSERILHRYLVYTKDLAKDQYVLMMPVFINCTFCNNTIIAS